MKTKNKKFSAPLKRKRLGKTDYKYRLRLLQARKPRFVVRRSLKNILVQLVDYRPDGDKVVLGVSTKELQRRFAWTGARGNTPAAYFAGLLAGKRAQERKISEAILDVGMQKVTRGSLLFAAVKGANDAGLKVAYDQAMAPDEDRIQGKHTKLKNIAFDRIKSAILASAAGNK